jgi:hypothetical protein
VKAVLKIVHAVSTGIFKRMKRNRLCSIRHAGDKNHHINLSARNEWRFAFKRSWRQGAYPGNSRQMFMALMVSSRRYVPLRGLPHFRWYVRVFLERRSPACAYSSRVLNGYMLDVAQRGAVFRAF